MKFGYKLDGPARKNGRSFAEMPQENDQVRVLTGMGVGDNFADKPRVGKLAPLRRAKEKPRQPIGKVLAEQQQVILSEGVEEQYRDTRVIPRLKRHHKLKQVFVRNNVGSSTIGRFSHQVVNRALGQLFLGECQVVGPFIRHEAQAGRCFARRHEVQGRLEEGIEGGGDEQVEIADFCQLPQRFRWREIRLLEQPVYVTIEAKGVS